MNAEVKERWLNALRSGEYKQTAFKLKTNDGFCCLGVLCDIYSKEFNVPWEKYLPVSFIEHDDTSPYSIGGEATGLPVEVLIWAGLSSPYPEVPYKILSDEHPLKDYKCDLTELNDSFRLDFNEISDIIENHL
jgi:hypothetical protein